MPALIEMVTGLAITEGLELAIVTATEAMPGRKAKMPSGASVCGSSSWACTGTYTCDSTLALPGTVPKMNPEGRSVTVGFDAGKPADETFNATVPLEASPMR